MAECDCDDYADPNKMILAGVLVGMALLAAFLIVLLHVIQANHREDAISRRAKYQACQAVENEPSRLVCINGWGG